MGEGQTQFVHKLRLATAPLLGRGPAAAGAGRGELSHPPVEAGCGPRRGPLTPRSAHTLVSSSLLALMSASTCFT